MCALGAAAARGAGSRGARAAGPGLGALPVWLARVGGTGAPSRVGSDPREQAAGWQRPKSAVTRRCQRVGTVPLFAKAGGAVPGLGTEHLLAARPVPSCLQQGPRAKETERCPGWTQLSSGCQHQAAQPGHTASLVPSSHLGCAPPAHQELPGAEAVEGFHRILESPELEGIFRREAARDVPGRVSAGRDLVLSLLGIDLC